MRTEIQIHPAAAKRVIVDSKEGQEVISLSVPAGKAQAVADAIRSVLILAGHHVHRVNPEGEDVVSAHEVFPDANPAMMLRGLRGKEGITQAELAAKLGIRQNMVSDMESGKRNISLAMARRIAEAFNVPYKMFL